MSVVQLIDVEKSLRRGHVRNGWDYLTYCDVRNLSTTDALRTSVLLMTNCVKNLPRQFVLLRGAGIQAIFPFG
jgi:hypothetical protein